MSLPTRILIVAVLSAKLGIVNVVHQRLGGWWGDLGAEGVGEGKLARGHEAFVREEVSLMCCIARILCRQKDLNFVHPLWT
jgi:hypothetical protein